MAHTHRAPKQWCLSKNETVNSFENWKQNLLYSLSLDTGFAPFLVTGRTWSKKSRTSPLRGFTDDVDDVPAEQRLTAEQKVTLLELMLGQIANYCPVIARNSIVKNSTSIDHIWQLIRLHYGFQSTGAHFIDFCEIVLEPDERAEDLYQRLTAFAEDNLLRHGSNITHHGIEVVEDEEISPSLENYIVLTWLRLIHKDLPKLVKQRYGTELRTRTLASIKPEISQALDSLLLEIHTSEDSRAMRTNISNKFNIPRGVGKASGASLSYRSNRPKKTCPICHQANRPDFHHFLSECKFLPDQDRKFLARARQVANIFDNEPFSEGEDEDQPLTRYSLQESTTLRVQVRQSPYLNAFYGHHVIHITIDSGATGNMIKLSTVTRLDITMTESSQSAHQADGTSPLKVVGEVRVTFTRDDKNFIFEGMVVENLDVEILAGTPFMEANDISVRPAKRLVMIGDNMKCSYGSTENNFSEHTIRRAHVLRAPAQTTTIWPGDYIEMDIPTDLRDATVLAMEPRFLAPYNFKDSEIWPEPNLLYTVSGKIRIPNMTATPKILKRHEHFCQVHTVAILDDLPGEVLTKPEVTCATVVPSQNTFFSGSVQVDPDEILPVNSRDKFRKLLQEYDDVFNPKFCGYNGASGPFKAVVNMGPVQPPQRKGRVPQYSRDKLVELQSKFNELEEMGVFVRPEDAGISVEYLNPSFLVKKSNGGYRLVTAFADVGRYSKPMPSLMPDVDSILRLIAQWKFIISTDLSNAFFQIPLSKDSMKYCGVATPFRGVFVYAWSAMGMPGSETALEEMMCRVLGELTEKGHVTKLADDLYCGGNSIDELYQRWNKVLEALNKNGLKLSAKKTTVCPKSVTLLGWIWDQGTIRASPHRIATLSSCTLPDTVRGLRSFVGAYKVLARVIPRCASLIGPLDDLTAGSQSNEKLVWSDQHKAVFERAQSELKSNRTIVLPRPDDILWIVTDGAVKDHGIGATLYVTRNGKAHIAGFFSAKLRGRQSTWIPCEIEALAIAVSTKHFSPFIIQSKHQACILTDSKPCVQAYEKLCRGEFSISPRVSTFLSIVSRYQASIRHLAGSANIPSDFASRNAPACTNQSCQICAFVECTEDSVVRHMSVDDIVRGSSRLPYSNRSLWRDIQSECSDLRRVHAHLVQGTRPSKKLTNIKDIKRYLNAVTVAKDGLLIVPRVTPLKESRECIVVPRSVINGLVTSLHIQLDHPSAHQLRQVLNRQFFALDMDKVVNSVTQSCHQCVSLRKIPHTVNEQSTSDPPDVIGVSFACDVMKREGQLIFVLRECVTAFTTTCLIDNEKAESLREALLRLCIELRPLDGPFAVIRADPAPGFKALVDDRFLKQHRLNIELGRVKNANKNPVAERAIQELGREIQRQAPMGGRITPLILSLATARLNTRIRFCGLSAREMWTQRDQFLCHALPLCDMDILQGKHRTREVNHPYSEYSKAPLSKMNHNMCISVGDLVYLYSDGNKLRARSRYLVTSVDGGWCCIRKFIGNQLRKTSYRVKISEVFKVYSDPQLCDLGYDVEDDSSANEDDVGSGVLPTGPVIHPEKDIKSGVPPTAPDILPDIPPTSPVILPDIPHALSEPAEEITATGNTFPSRDPCLLQNKTINNGSVESVQNTCTTPVCDLNGARRSTRTRKLPAKYSDFILS